MTTPANYLELCGWGQKSQTEAERTEFARRAFGEIAKRFVAFALPTADTKASYRIWDIARKVIGGDVKIAPQETGDCVAAGAEAVINYLQTTEIAMGEPEEYRPVYRPYLYGTGRVYVGRGQFRGQEGSSGSWQADAVGKYGVLRSDHEGVPAYSGKLCNRWGDSDAEWKKFVDIADDHLVLQRAEITSLEQMATAIANGYPLTTASNRGYTMTAGSDGYHKEGESWPHQMHVNGCGLGAPKPWVAMGNQWGDVHGVVRDFETGEEWPRGTLRITPEAMLRRIRDGEVYAFSGFDGFKVRNPWSAAFGWGSGV